MSIHRHRRKARGRTGTAATASSLQSRLSTAASPSEVQGNMLGNSGIGSVGQRGNLLEEKLQYVMLNTVGYPQVLTLPLRYIHRTEHENTLQALASCAPTPALHRARHPGLSSPPPTSSTPNSRESPGIVAVACPRRGYSLPQSPAAVTHLARDQCRYLRYQCGELEPGTAMRVP